MRIINAVAATVEVCRVMVSAVARNAVIVGNTGVGTVEEPSVVQMRRNRLVRNPAGKVTVVPVVKVTANVPMLWVPPVPRGAEAERPVRVQSAPIPTPISSVKR